MSLVLGLDSVSATGDVYCIIYLNYRERDLRVDNSDVALCCWE